MKSFFTLAVVLSLVLIDHIGTEPSYYPNSYAYYDHPYYNLNGDNKTVIYGRRQFGDKLDYYRTVYKPFVRWHTQSENVTYPLQGHTGWLITCIVARDDKARNSGNVYLLKGGVGSKNVTLRIKSERGHGYKFTISVYVRGY